MPIVTSLDTLKTTIETNATVTREFASMSALLADTTLGYGAIGKLRVTAGQIIRTREENYVFAVALLTAVDNTHSTAGGVKLYSRGAIRPSSTGSALVSNDGTQQLSVANDGIRLGTSLVSSTGRLFLTSPETYVQQTTALVNGNFGIWQRGTSFSATGFTADRWALFSDGGTTTVSRQTFPIGTKMGTNTPEFFLRIAASGHSGNTSRAQLAQPIEDVRTYAGETVTVLGWARRNSGSGDIAMDFFQFFGASGLPANGQYAPGQRVTLTSSWQPFAVTFSIPSISSATIGTDDGDGLALAIFASAGSSYNGRTASLGIQTIEVDLYGLHIMKGTYSSSALGFYNEPDRLYELERCQRFYQLVNYSSSFTAAAASNRLGTTIHLPVPMRVTPSTTVPTAGTLTNVTTATIDQLTPSSARVEIVSTAAGTCSLTGRVYAFSAEF